MVVIPTAFHIFHKGQLCQKILFLKSMRSKAKIPIVNCIYHKGQLCQKILFLISMKSKVKIPTVNHIYHQCLPFPQPTNTSESVRTVTFFKVGTLPHDYFMQKPLSSSF